MPIQIKRSLLNEERSHLRIFMISDEQRNIKPYAVPVRVLPCRVVKDEEMRRLKDELKRTIRWTLSNLAVVMVRRFASQLHGRLSDSNNTRFREETAATDENDFGEKGNKTMAEVIEDREKQQRERGEAKMNAQAEEHKMLLKKKEDQQDTQKKTVGGVWWTRPTIVTSPNIQFKPVTPAQFTLQAQRQVQVGFIDEEEAADNVSSINAHFTMKAVEVTQEQRDHQKTVSQSTNHTCASTSVAAKRTEERSMQDE
ncbi:hypothetical protein Bbelb_350340 [Branchiostoma belcheri]|nr:hypothetical protein Bbelb_350340 [Branchiostoma belcheri]